MHMHVCVCCGQLIGEKVAHAYACVCCGQLIGEKLDEREANKTEEVGFRQMQAIAGTTTTLLLLLCLFFQAHQHKAAGRKTRLDVQNYGCNGNLLCDHGVVERNRISSLQSHGKGVGKGMLSPGCLL